MRPFTLMELMTCLSPGRTMQTRSTSNEPPYGTVPRGEYVLTINSFSRRVLSAIMGGTVSGPIWDGQTRGGINGSATLRNQISRLLVGMECLMGYSIRWASVIVLASAEQEILYSLGSGSHKSYCHHLCWELLILWITMFSSETPQDQRIGNVNILSPLWIW